MESDDSKVTTPQLGPILKSMNISDLMRDYWQRGVTYRKTANGRRPMFHRWPASKIKGAIRIQDIMAENIMRHNTLLKHLRAKNDPRISPRDQDLR